MNKVNFMAQPKTRSTGNLRLLLWGAIGSTVASLNSIVAIANPQGAQVVAGQATIGQGEPVQGSNPSLSTPFVVDQQSQNAVIDYDSFSINQSEVVIFNQPNAQAITLNRVTGLESSMIDGQLQANGQVFLINPNGVLFSQNAQIDVGGIVASTHSMDATTFMQQNYELLNNATTGRSSASVVNEAVIGGSNLQYVVLVADQVENSGQITTTGTALLASAQRVGLDIDGDGLISFSVTGANLQSDAQVLNSGLLQARRVAMTAETTNAMMQTAVNNTGSIEAQGINEVNGEIWLTANGGGLSHAGEIIASENANIQITSNNNIGFDGSLTAPSSNVQIIAEQQLQLTSVASVDVSPASMGSNGGQLELIGRQRLQVDGLVQAGSAGTILYGSQAILIGDGAATTPDSGGLQTDSPDPPPSLREDLLESQLQAGTDVTIQMTDVILIGDMADGALNGQNAGTGGDLQLLVDAANRTGSFDGSGFEDSIIDMNTPDSIVLDGSFRAENGDTFNQPNDPALSNKRIELNDITANQIQTLALGEVSLGTVTMLSNAQSPVNPEVLLRSSTGTIATQDITLDGSGLEANTHANPTLSLTFNGPAAITVDGQIKIDAINASATGTGQRQDVFLSSILHNSNDSFSVTGNTDITATGSIDISLDSPVIQTSNLTATANELLTFRSDTTNGLGTFPAGVMQLQAGTIQLTAANQSGNNTATALNVDMFSPSVSSGGITLQALDLNSGNGNIVARLDYQNANADAVLNIGSLITTSAANTQLHIQNGGALTIGSITGNASNSLNHIMSAAGNLQLSSAVSLNGQNTRLLLLSDGTVSNSSIDLMASNQALFLAGTSGARLGSFSTGMGDINIVGNQADGRFALQSLSDDSRFNAAQQDINNASSHGALLSIHANDAIATQGLSSQADAGPASIDLSTSNNTATIQTGPLSSTGLAQAEGNLSVNNGIRIAGAQAVQVFGESSVVDTRANASDPRVTDFRISATDAITLNGGLSMAGQNLLRGLLSSGADLTVTGDIALQNTQNTASITGNMLSMNAGSQLSLQDAMVESGTLALTAGTDLSANTSTLAADGIGIRAGGNLDLANGSVTIGSRSVSGFGGDPTLAQLLGNLAPVSTQPNGSFIAGGDVQIGSLTSTGDHLHFVSPQLPGLDNVTTPMDVVVQYQPFNRAANIGLENLAHTRQNSHADAQFFQRFTGTTIVIGGFDQNGDIVVGEDGPVNFGTQNLALTTNGDIILFSDVDTSGQLINVTRSQPPRPEEDPKPPTSEPEDPNQTSNTDKDEDEEKTATDEEQKGYQEDAPLIKVDSTPNNDEEAEQCTI